MLYACLYLYISEDKSTYVLIKYDYAFYKILQDHIVLGLHPWNNCEIPQNGIVVSFGLSIGDWGQSLSFLP